MSLENSRVRKMVFPSGLVLIHERTPSYPVVAYHLWIKAGSAHEGPGELGSAHFLEHMLFKGTETRDAATLNDEVENFGGQINAFTTFDYTAYHLVLSSRFWREGLTLLWDMVFHPLLDEDDLALEKQVIEEEIQEADDSGDSKLSDRFFAALYPGHGYGRPILGTKGSVAAVDADSLRSFYQRYYHPSNIVLAVAGDVDQERLYESVRELEQEFAGEDPRTIPPVASATLPDRPVSEIVNFGAEERILELAFAIPDVHHPDIPAIDVLSILLGEGETSRLYRELRLRKELARGIESSLFIPRGRGQILIRAQPYRETGLRLLQETGVEIARARSERISSRELSNAKLLLDKELLFNDETVEGRARTLAYYETVFGSPDEEAKYRDRVLGVTERQLSEVARKYLDPEKMGMAWLLPSGETAPTSEELEAIRHPKPAPRKNRDLPSNTAPLLRWTYPNGTRVVYRALPQVRIASAYAASIGGTYSETPETNGISTLIAASIDRGTASRSDERIAEELASLQAELNGVAGQNSLGLRMDLASENLFSALDLFTDILHEPSFDPEVIEQERTGILRDLETQKDYFETIAQNLCLETLFPHHPYGMNPLGNADSLKRLDSTAIHAHYSRYTHPRRVVLGIVGSVEPEALRETLESFLPADEPETPPISPPSSLQPLTAARELRRPINGEKAYLHLGFRGRPQSSPDRHAMDVLAASLASSGGGRLFFRIREELGLAYSVDAHAAHGLDAGYLAVVLNTAADRAERALDEVRTQLKLVRNEPLRSEELTRVKNFLIGSYELDLQRSSSQASQLCVGELLGVDRDLGDYVRGIHAVTTEQVLALAQSVIDLDRSVLVWLSPAVH